MRDVLARNVDIVNKQDKAVAHLLDELQADGLAEETSPFLRNHRCVYPQELAYRQRDDGLNIPLIVRLPDAYQHLAERPVGQAVDELVSHVDMAPTTLSLAGIPLQIP